MSQEIQKQKKARKATAPQQIDVRISAPSRKGCDGIVQVLAQIYRFDKRTLPYPYTCEDGSVQYTTYVTISRYRN